MATAYPDAKDSKIVDMDKEIPEKNGESKDSGEKMETVIVKKFEGSRKNWRKEAVKLERHVSKDVFADSDDEKDSDASISEEKDSEEVRKAQEHLKNLNIQFMDEIFRVAATFKSTKDRIEMIKKLGDEYYKDEKIRHAPQPLRFPATSFTGEVLSRHVQNTYIDLMPSLNNSVDLKKRKGDTINCNEAKMPKTEE
ncbi:hypothetical protein CRE_26732 [Caenorhabditis remanei]|uniref:Uncharacterized protein n=1 Tax=Caenorhabditis remanei TaxID=31234 RepID=E3MXX3_CAERE|nr:hypothetical protein CRE_26732 [Caenorhabditis remanei]